MLLSTVLMSASFSIAGGVRAPQYSSSFIWRRGSLSRRREPIAWLLLRLGFDSRFWPGSTASLLLLGLVLSSHFHASRPTRRHCGSGGGEIDCEAINGALQDRPLPPAPLAQLLGAFVHLDEEQRGLAWEVPRAAA